MRLTLIHEGFGSFEYKVPADKEHQLYDFYMSDMINGSLKRRNGEMDSTDMLAHAVEQTRETLLPVLRGNLLDAVYFSLAAELRHVFLMTDNLELWKFKHEPEQIKAVLGPEHFETYARYAKQYAKHLEANYGAQSAGPEPKYEEPTNKDLRGDAKRMVAFGVAEHTAGGNRRAFVEFALAIFTKGIWSSKFGGDAWATIAAAWLKLNAARGLNDMAVWIDHIYDLQHNTGSVLNKLDTYAKAGRFTWLKDALDNKRDIKDPRALLKLVSPQMRMLASAAIKASGGGTAEDYEKKQQAERERAASEVRDGNYDEFDIPVGSYQGIDDLDLDTSAFDADFDMELPQKERRERPKK